MSQKQITIVAAIIQNEQGDLLLTKRYQPEVPEIHGIWEFAGGGVDFGEDPIVAIKREVREEIGVEVEVKGLLPKIISDIQDFDNGDKLQVLVLSYKCTILSGQPHPVDAEIAEVKFFPLTEIKSLKAFKNIYETLDLLNS